jgi:hypothetical protein
VTSARRKSTRTSPNGRRAPKLGFDAGEELDHFERLRDVVVRPQLQADDLVHDLPPGGEHYDRSLDVSLAKLAQHVEAAHPWQHDVEQHEIEALGAGALEAALAVGTRVDGVAFAGEAIGERQDEPGLVFDEEQPLGAHELETGCAEPTGRALASSPAAGSCTVNSLPCPGVLLTVTRPPCDSTIRWTRLSPRPAP